MVYLNRFLGIHVGKRRSDRLARCPVPSDDGVPDHLSDCAALAEIPLWTLSWVAVMAVVCAGRPLAHDLCESVFANARTQNTVARSTSGAFGVSVGDVLRRGGVAEGRTKQVVEWLNRIHKVIVNSQMFKVGSRKMQPKVSGSFWKIL